VLILDADPPPLTRRGAAARWAEALAGADGSVDVAAEVARRRFVRADHLRALGAGDEIPSGVRCLDEWLVAEAAWDEAVARVAPVLASWSDAHPLEAGMPVAVLRRELGLPDDRVATSVATAAGVPVAEGRLRSERRPDLGPAERAVAELERRLAADPFAAPEVHELADLRLARRELAAAEAAGRLLRVTPEIVLLPSAPDDAVRRLATLDQPFTTSEARQALGTTRRVAVPLLEYLDANGRTERVDASRRRVR
jgi:selenocysteine-specific elongation factor